MLFVNFTTYATSEPSRLAVSIILQTGHSCDFRNLLLTAGDRCRTQDWFLQKFCGWSHHHTPNFLYRFRRFSIMFLEEIGEIAAATCGNFPNLCIFSCMKNVRDKNQSFWRILYNFSSETTTNISSKTFSMFNWACVFCKHQAIDFRISFVFREIFALVVLFLERITGTVFKEVKFVTVIFPMS